MEESLFTKYGLKKTQNREKIYEALKESDSPITAESLFAQFDGRIDLSTIYRTLNTFVRVDLVKKEFNDQKENVFLLSREEDSHLLVCVKCHKKIALSGCPYHEVNESIQERTGFIVQDQNVEIYGICPDCQKKKAP